MLRDALTRWMAPAVTGAVTLELRRGDDYTILDTKAQYMSYAPDKLSMEKVRSRRSPPRTASARSSCRTSRSATTATCSCTTSTRSASSGPRAARRRSGRPPPFRLECPAMVLPTRTRPAPSPTAPRISSPA